MANGTEWTFFSFNVVGFVLSFLCILPLLTSKNFWKFPVRILYLTSFPMAFCSLSFMIGIHYMYNSEEESQTNRPFCYIQSYLLNFGVQLIYSLAIFYIHLVFQIVYLRREESSLKYQEKIYFVFLFLTSLTYVISNELTGGPQSAGPWCSTGNPIVLVVFPYILYSPFAIVMAIESALIIKKIWMVKKKLKTDTHTTDYEKSVSGNEKGTNPPPKISYQDYNLYFRISCMCFALSLSLFIAGVRRAISSFGNSNSNDTLTPFFIYPVAIILESIVILLSQKILKFYKSLITFRSFPGNLQDTSKISVTNDEIAAQTING